MVDMNTNRPTPRQIIDAANYLDYYGDPDGSLAYAPTGIGNIGPERAREMIAAAVALGMEI